MRETASRRSTRMVVGTAILGLCLIAAAGCGSDSKTSNDTVTGQDVQGTPDVQSTEDVQSAPDADGSVGQDSTTDTGSACADDFAPQSVNGISIEFVESGARVKNTWEFGETQATLASAGDFPYTYERIDGCASVIVFDVGGKDRYEMSWTSATGGTCTESFEGSAPSPCTFQVVQ